MRFQIRVEFCRKYRRVTEKWSDDSSINQITRCCLYICVCMNDVFIESRSKRVTLWPFNVQHYIYNGSPDPKSAYYIHSVEIILRLLNICDKTLSNILKITNILGVVKIIFTKPKIKAYNFVDSIYLCCQVCKLLILWSSVLSPSNGDSITSYAFELLFLLVLLLYRKIYRIFYTKNLFKERLIPQQKKSNIFSNPGT